MVSTTDFNVSPYFDDFQEEKKFLRHLFRPGFAVQARELTQIQTILQNQIDRFGSHIFEDGSKVIGSDISDQNIKFLRVNPQFDFGSGPQDLVPEDFIDTEITDALVDTDPSTTPDILGTLKAKVFHAIAETGDDPYVILFIEYISTGSLQLTDSSNYVSGEDLLVGETVTGGTSGATATVVAWSPAAVGNPGSRLYLSDAIGTFQDGEVVTGGTSTFAITIASGGQLNRLEFQPQDQLVSSNTVTLTKATVKSSTVDPNIAVTGDAILASIDEGIFFIDGFFVLNDAQRVVPFRPAVAGDSPVPLNVRVFSGINARIGFDISKDVVRSDTDSSLLDPAFGSPNFNAPGADRYRIRLLINFKLFADTADTPTDFADENFVEWMRVRRDVVVLQAVRPDYSALENELAQRTQDINGSFTVRSFNPDIRPHLKNDLYILTVSGQLGTFQVGEQATGGTSGAVGVVNFITDFDISFLMLSGTFLVGETITGGTSGATATVSTIDFQEDLKGVFSLVQGGGEDKIAFGLEPGKAFVQGFQFENLETEFVKVDKGRDTGTVGNFNVGTSFGNYVLVDSNGDTAFENWNLTFDMDTVPVVNLNDANSVQVGTGRVRQIQRDSSVAYRIYLFDTAFDSGKSIADVREIEDGATLFWNIREPEGIDASIVNRLGNPGTILFASNTNKLVFPVPVGESTEKFVETDWRSQQQFTVSLNASGIGSVSTGDPDIRFVGGAPTIVAGSDLGFYTVVDPPSGAIIDMSAVGNQVETNNNLPTSNGQVTLTIPSLPSQSVTLIATLDINDDNPSLEPLIRRNKVLQKNFTVPTDVFLVADLILRGGGSIATPLAGALDGNFDFATPEAINLPVGTATLDTAGKIVAELTWTYATAGDFTGPFTVGETVTGGTSSSTALVNCDFIDVDASATLAAGTPGTPQTFFPGEYVFEDTGGDTLFTSPAVAVALSPTSFRFVTGQFSDGALLVGVSSGATRTFFVEVLGTSFSVYRGAIFDMNAATVGVFSEGEPATFGTSANLIQIQTIFNYRARALFTLDALADVFEVGDTITGATTGFSAEVVAVSFTGTVPLADIFGVVSINADPTGTNVPVDGAFFVDNGQRDNLYDHATIEYDDQSGISVPQPVRLVVNYFEHQGNGPLYVNSYTHTSPGSNLRFEHIPLYTSPQTGETVALRDTIDFRPIRDPSGTIIKVFLPQAGQAFDADYSFHLPRIDKIVLRKEQLFDVIRGIPSLEAEIPADEPDALTLYVVSVPPYTYNVEDVKIRYIENKRYTMRDIGGIERRVQRLEYYTSLTLLEQQTETLSIPDAAGEDRFKSGIIVDSFQGHNIGDVLNPDYDCAIDFEEKELRPPFIDRIIELEELTNNGNVSVSPDGLVTMAYTETPLVFQPLSSTAISVNPFDVVNWMGSMTLTPSSDIWIDVEQRPEVRVNLEGENDAWTAIATAANGALPNGFGTAWGAWEQNWTGRTERRTTFQRTSRRRISAPHASRGPDGVFRQRVEDTVETVERTVEVLRGRETRLGIQTRVVPERIERSLGNRVVDVSIVPFIRPQDLLVNAEGMKPNTRVYPYFDCVAVSEFCTPQGGAQGDPIVTDAAGKVVNLSFALPAGRFRTGDRLFRLTDEPNNIVANALTSSERMWNAQGLLQSREEAIVSTRVPVLRRQSVTQSRPARDVRTRDRTVRAQTRMRWVDPLAQTFLVDSNLHPNGVFLTSLDLFFRAIPTNSSVPVTIQIRPVVNGFPHSSAVVPFSEVSLEPTFVNTSDTPDPSNAATKTTFTFSSPVYLSGGQEYAVVILSNSNEYLTYIATIGQNQLGTEDRISMQPYAGSMFRSQNASTWTPDQTSDLMFTLNRALFNTAVVGQIDFRNVLAANMTSPPPVSLPDEAGINELYLLSNQLEFPDSTLTLSVDTSTTGSLFGNFRTILANQREKFDSKQKVLMTTNPESLILRASMTTADDAISPTLDQDRLGVIVIENRVNDERNTNTGEPTYNGELEPRAFTAHDPDVVPSDGFTGPMARYVTRLVTLEPGFEASDMRVFLTVNKRIESEIQVFVKVQPPEAEGDFPNERYLQLEPEQNVISENDDDFREMEFRLPAELPEPFSKFVVKVTMYSGNTSVVPRIRDLRAIAVI